MKDNMNVNPVTGTYHNSIKSDEVKSKLEQTFGETIEKKAVESTEILEPEKTYQIPEKEKSYEKDWYTDYCARKKRNLYNRREKELLQERRMERKKKLKEYYEEIWEKKTQTKKLQRKLYNQKRISWAAAEYEAKMIVDTMDVKKLFMNL